LEDISDSFNRKALILSQLNRESNLFLHLASEEYNRKNYFEAIELIEKNLKGSSNNPAAQIILCKAYAQLGEFHQAVQQLKSVSTTIRSPKTFNFYLKEIEKIQKKELKDFDTGISQPPDYKISGDFKQRNVSASVESKTYETMLVSETLAKIYIAQGEIGEAIKIYEKLTERKPDKKETYLKKIEELKFRLEK